MHNAFFSCFSANRVKLHLRLGITALVEWYKILQVGFCVLSFLMTI
jgi:hypothetical protein